MASIHKEGSLAVDKCTEVGPSVKKPRIDHSRVTKNITDIFAADPTDLTETGTSSTVGPKRILIEGAPGIGKTVLAKEIAYQWATNEILTEIKIVYLLYLRDSELQSIKSTKQLVQYMSMGCLDDEQITTFDKYFVNKKGQQLCIVMDGFDEYPSLLQQNSFIVDIINGVILPEAIVVITSRPTATVSLHGRVDRRIDILGLPKEEREKYISQAFSDSSDKKDALDKYLKQQPVINGLCFVPLHLAILLYLFQQGSLPETLTEMNESFILHTIYRHLKRHGQTTSGAVDKLAKVPKPILNIVYNLSELAFKGLQDNKLVFTFEEVKEVCSYVDETVGAINGFGLLQAVEHYPNKGAGTTTSFNFLHYTMQEYLAALHVSNLPSEQQSSLMKKTFWDGHYNFMWMMFVGIVGINSEIFVNFVSKGKVYKRKSGIRMAENILSDKRKRLHVFQCYMEAKSSTEAPDVISDMFKDGKVILRVEKLLPHHISSLMTFMSNSSIQWKTLELTYCKITEIGMNVLEQFISEKLSTLEYVDLIENESSPWGVYCAIIRHCSVNSLTLCGDCGIEDYASEIKESLQMNTKLLSLTLCNIGNNGAITLAEAIQVNTTLQKINISSNSISDDGVAAISNSIKFNTSLQELNISRNMITSEGTKYIAEAIQVNTTLERLDLSCNAVSDDGATAFSNSLKYNNSLQELNISRNKITSEGTKYIAEAIQVNTTLERHDLSCNAVSDDGATAFSNSLKYNNSLQELNISRNKITSEGTKCIAEAIVLNTTLQKLDLSCNAVSDDGVAAISDNLKFNTSLQELNISHNSITNKGIKVIAKVIQIKSTLQNVDISKNHISVEGLVYFMEAVKNNCTLQVVNITHNNVTRSGFTSIKQCIKNLQHPIQIYASWNEINQYDKLVTKISTSCAPDNIEDDVWSFDEYDADHLVMCLSECLKEDDTLQELNMSYNKITNEGAKMIGEAIKVNKTLQKLCINDNSISDDGAAAISDGLKYNNSLQELDISWNKITKEGIKLIAEAIKVNTTLHTLNLYQYSINGALSCNMTVLTAVYHNNTLMKLTLPWVFGDDERLVSSEVEKINKERTRQGISTLTCDYS